jgi:hypothetical protein
MPLIVGHRKVCGCIVRARVVDPRLTPNTRAWLWRDMKTHGLRPKEIDTDDVVTPVVCRHVHRKSR